MPIVLTNLISFIETPGRRRSLKRGSFDSLTCVLTGPQSQKDRWVPNLESPHTNIDPQGYPLMLCTDVQDIEQEGALVTTSVTYQGRMYINGFQPTPVLSISSTETSASVQIAASQVVNTGKVIVTPIYQTQQGQPQGFQLLRYDYTTSGRVVRYGYSTVTINYISTSVTAKYQTLVRPTGPKGGHLSDGCSIGIISTIIGEVSGVEVTYLPDGTTGGVVLPPVIGPDYRTLIAPTPKLVCTSFSAMQVAGTFYDCTETWELKYIDASHTV